MSEEEVAAGTPAWPGGARSNDPWAGYWLDVSANGPGLVAAAVLHV